MSCRFALKFAISPAACRCSRIAAFRGLDRRAIRCRSNLTPSVAAISRRVPFRFEIRSVMSDEYYWVALSLLLPPILTRARQLERTRGSARRGCCGLAAGREFARGSVRQRKWGERRGKNLTRAHYVTTRFRLPRPRSTSLPERKNAKCA